MTAARGAAALPGLPGPSDDLRLWGKIAPPPPPPPPALPAPAGQSSVVRQRAGQKKDDYESRRNLCWTQRTAGDADRVHVVREAAAARTARWQSGATPSDKSWKQGGLPTWRSSTGMSSEYSRMLSEMSDGNAPCAAV